MTKALSTHERNVARPIAIAVLLTATQFGLTGHANAETPSAAGALTTYFEGDFFGTDGNESSSNSNGFRLRHFYGQLGNLMAGQSLFAVPNSATLSRADDDRYQCRRSARTRRRAGVPCRSSTSARN